ncbi:MAG TPA: nucleoside diphosphate kinase regulator [Kiritimatiellia bacterium]|nr:nucleoside diphosphate kinase regulator [Kiritimatiellia bacterium]HRU70437.1 nucleoside diphosphate kinase regulator [Kiritimatiellia bacterium]
MQQRKLYVTQNDFKKLQELLEGGGTVHDRDRKDLSALAEELKKATIVTPDTLPANVVTMNSRLRLMDLDTRKPFEMTVVFPQDADVDTGKVSVISPVGTAVLGYAEGDTIEWSVPAGTRRLMIEKVLYQPEAAGDLHL